MKRLCKDLVSCFGALAFLISCSPQPSHTISANRYIRSEFIGKSVTNDHERYFVAHNKADLTNWINAKMLDEHLLNEYNNVDYSNHVVVISVGSQLGNARQISGGTVVLSLIPQREQGVGIALVKGKVDLFFKFN
jgi:hypothetical protein